MTFKPGNIIVGYSEGHVLACGEVQKVKPHGVPAYQVADLASGRLVWVFATEALAWKIWGACLTEDETYRRAFAAYWTAAR